MKIGVVTPTHTANYAVLAECIKAVSEAADSAQRNAGVETIHIIVSDGPESAIFGMSTHVVNLPESARDAGATPRAVGSAYALGQGCDVIAFVDDDNRLDALHLSTAMKHIARGVEVITSLRWMVHPDGTRLYIDQNDSDGIAFADTNTIVLAGRAAKFATTWNWGVSSSGADRLFWDRVTHSFKGKIACTGMATVHYTTRWAAHYNPAPGRPEWMTCPSPAKWPVTRSDGKRAALVAHPIWNEQAKVWEPDMATATINGERVCLPVPEGEAAE